MTCAGWTFPVNLTAPPWLLPSGASPRSYASWNEHFDEILTYLHMLSLIGSIEGEFISQPVVGKPFKHPTRAQSIMI
jgi:hypothetical protein